MLDDSPVFFVVLSVLGIHILLLGGSPWARCCFIFDGARIISRLFILMVNQLLILGFIGFGLQRHLLFNHHGLVSYVSELVLEEGSSRSEHLLSCDSHTLSLPVIEALLGGNNSQMRLLDGEIPILEIRVGKIVIYLFRVVASPGTRWERNCHD